MEVTVHGPAALGLDSMKSTTTLLLASWRKDIAKKSGTPQKRVEDGRSAPDETSRYSSKLSDIPFSCRQPGITKELARHPHAGAFFFASDLSRQLDMRLYYHPPLHTCWSWRVWCFTPNILVEETTRWCHAGTTSTAPPSLLNLRKRKLAQTHFMLDTAWACEQCQVMRRGGSQCCCSKEQSKRA